MYEYGDLCCSSTNFLSYLPETTSFMPANFPSVVAPPPPPPPPPPLPVVPATITIPSNELISLVLEVPSPLPSCYIQRPSLIQRSMSSHSLQKDRFQNNLIFSSLEEVLDLDSGPMRKVHSTGDLQTTNSAQNSCRSRSESPLSQESSTAEGINKVGRYSVEERKERIERYRSKRNQRNFNKKIKYACRKTLADSRPRIRGRFARNEEIGETSQNRWSQMGGDEDEEEEDVWINFLNANANANLIL